MTELSSGSSEVITGIEKIIPMEITKAPTQKKATLLSKDDLLQAVAHEVETVKNEQQAHKELSNAFQSSEMNLFRMGGLFAVIQTKGWFAGQKNLRDFCDHVANVNYRKAMYLIEIYKALVASNVRWEQVESIGWTKLKEIANQLTPENVTEWTQRCSDMTHIELLEFLKQQKSLPSATDNVEEINEHKSRMTTKTFKIFEDQKETLKAAIERAKEENATEHDAVALEAICMHYLEGTVAPLQSVRDFVKQHSPVDILQEIQSQYEDIDFKVDVPEKYFP